MPYGIGSHDRSRANSIRLYVHERAKITRWLQTSMRDPNTNLELLTKRLTLDDSMRHEIVAWKSPQRLPPSKKVGFVLSFIY